LLQPAIIGAVSTVQHPGYASIHLLLFNHFAARNLIDGQAHLLVEPGFFGKHAINGFYNQISRGTTRARGETCERRGLLFGELKFHS
jgi:hypothetical protein